MQNDIALKDAENAQRSDLRNSKVPECLYWSVDDVAEYFENINFTWIPRETNGYADFLSNKYQMDKLI